MDDGKTLTREHRLTRWALHNGLKRHGIIREHCGKKGARWHRIPKGVADKIAAMRGAK